jgi:hypothetical protein
VTYTRSPASLRRRTADTGTITMKIDFVRTAALGGLLGLLAGIAVTAAPMGVQDTTAKIDNFTF